MRALALTAIGGPEHLAVLGLPVPELAAPDDVRVRVHAAALNHLDLFVASGLPGPPLPLPHVVGTDGAGVVDAVGPAVAEWRLGDRVMINPALSCGICPYCAAGQESLCVRFRVLGEHRSGTAAEYVVVPAANLGRVPTAMSWAEAAAFSLATLTAWRMLTTRAHVVAGETVLVWGFGGGVAQAALQVAHLLGARVIATSGSPDKLERARAAGAEGTIDHSREDVVVRVRELTGGLGADVVVDTVGEQTWDRSLRALRRGGRLVTCGATTGPHVGIDMRRLFWHQWSILGSTMGSRREYAAIVALAHEGKLWPRVDRVVPLARGIEAFQRLARGEQAGKQVIEVTS
jgi:NADPH:quinone reductase-like Zn-dependent oxidoreductase